MISINVILLVSLLCTLCVFDTTTVEAQELSPTVTMRPTLSARVEPTDRNERDHRRPPYTPNSASTVVPPTPAPVPSILSEITESTHTPNAARPPRPNNRGPTKTPVAVTLGPTKSPTVTPTLGPTIAPTMTPTLGPTIAPTMTPTLAPTKAPTMTPTLAPTKAPTMTPTFAPTMTPTAAPVPISCHGITATPISPPATVSGDTSNALFQKFPDCPSTTPNDIQPTIFNGGSKSIFYNVLGTGRSMSSTTCLPGTLFDTKITVYSFQVNCARIQCVAADDNDQACGSGNAFSTVTWSSVADQVYLILVNGAGSFSGTFQLSVN